MNPSSDATLLVDLQLSHLKMKDLESLHFLAQMLAQFFSDPEGCITAVHELLMNAIEHGNLGIGCDHKTDLIMMGKWRDEITRRLNEPDLAARTVDIRLEQEGNMRRLHIADQGQGFNVEEYMEAKIPTRKPNGRGLWIAFNSAFSRVAFNEKGNAVYCEGKSLS
jgi:two-component system, cell cycle response regulator